MGNPVEKKFNVHERQNKLVMPHNPQIPGGQELAFGM